ncbi:MAM and LDL-receptor class A domain-containing protein [Elysia marginata]|uniref:MAM and LDL-receptor class A domain-containing protein n=1 Tax=Elysia marginata TaxID=1093978 RepID=A0AAV4IID7_9GAST|nr:MAM and LDL-receptor class A domain-containing protein [Elysia marginata]
MGSLEVVIWPSGLAYPDGSATPEWSVKGSHGDLWIKETVLIRNTATPYKIILRARTGGPSTSDVALDDVTVRSSSAGVGVTTTSATSPQPVAVSSTVLYRCDFDYGSICSWAHPRTAPMKWIVRKDSTPTPRTGANHDHTSGKGDLL